MSKLNRYEKSVLDLIAYAEGTLGVSQNGYDVTVNYFKIVGWTENTNIVHGNLNWIQKVGNIESTASGRYQYKYETWVGINNKKNLPMTKKNQDNAAIKSVKNRLKQRDLEKRDVSLGELENKGKFNIFLNKIAREWASIPLTKDFTVDGIKRFSGSSYYASDKTNKSKDSPEVLYDVFLKALSKYP